MGGEHVLQRYLVSPHLLRGHKYSIRLFVVITNYAGAYLYPHGYFNVALQSYQPHDFSELGPHLTNEHLSEPTANVVQIPTTQFDFYEQFYPQLKATVTAVVKGLKIHYPTAFICQRQRAFAIFGFDFMVDADKRVWLLEANHGPWFPIHDEHPLQKHLYRAFWQALINSFVVPIAMRQPVEYIRYHSFESLL